MVKKSGPASRRRVSVRTPLTVIGCCLPALMSDACDSVTPRHARNRAEALLHIRVERGGSRFLISNLQRVQIEQQQGVAVVAEWNSVEVRKRSYKEPSGDQQ